LDRTCVNLRSNRFPPIEPGFSDGQTEWKKAPLGFKLTLRRAVSLTVAESRFNQSEAIIPQVRLCDQEAFEVY
jgi:hypothetical protein